MATAKPPVPVTPDDLVKGLARAFAGALIFGLPMLMTSELWELGARLDRLRLALLVALAIPLLVGVAHRAGFEPTFGWREDLRDAALALSVGLLGSGTILLLFNHLGTPASLDQVVGRIAIQAVPAALGALLARNQLRGGGGGDGPRAFGGYFGTLFMMLVGALFLSFNMAPTEEMLLVAFAMTPWHGICLVALQPRRHPPLRARPRQPQRPVERPGLERLPALLAARLRAGAGDQPLQPLGLRPARRLRRRHRPDGDGGAGLPGDPRRRRRADDPVSPRRTAAPATAAARRRPAAPRQAATARSRTEWLEWALGAVSGLIVLALVAYLAFEGVTDARAVPDLEIAAAPPAAAPARPELRFTLSNRGGRAATAVAVSMTLREGTRVAGVSRLTVDQVPPRSTVTGAFLLPSDAAGLTPVLAVEGYLDP